MDGAVGAEPAPVAAPAGLRGSIGPQAPAALPIVPQVPARVEIRTFTTHETHSTAELVDRFVAVGERLQPTMQGRIPVAGAVVRERLAPSFGWHAHGTARHFVATASGIDTGRCSAMVNHREQPTADGGAVGYVGQWECIDDDASATALLEVATQWLREQGCTQVVGPIDYSTWYSYRFRDGEGDGRAPLLLETTTPDHYVRQWRAFGFIDHESYFSAEIAEPVEQVKMARPLVRDLVEQGWRIRQLRSGEWDSLIERIHAMSTAEFTRQPHYTPIDLADFRASYESARRGVDPRYVMTAWSPDGEFAGFVFGVRNLGAAAKHLARTPGILGRLRALRAAWSTDTMMVKTICVARPHRALGIAIFLQSALYRAAFDTGHPRVANLLMHENNRSKFLTEAAGGRPFRRYVLLRLPMG